MKMKTKGLTFATLALVAAAGFARAEGWTVSDLGNMPDREFCRDKANAVLARYKRVHEGGTVDQQSWTIYGYDMAPGDNDVMVMCPIVAGQINGFLVVYGEEDEDDRKYVSETLLRYWQD